MSDEGRESNPERAEATGARDDSGADEKPTPAASAPDGGGTASAGPESGGTEQGGAGPAVVRRSAQRFQAAVRWSLLRQTEVLATGVTGLRRGMQCVVSTARGTEVGEILTAEVPIEAETVKESRGSILRIASEDDLQRHRQNRIEKPDPLFQQCQERIRKHKLPMKLCAIEPLLGGERTIVYFTSEGRVDFRALVRDLARNLRGRVEMRQIGAREEAKLLGSYSDCGQPLCCRAFLGTLEPIPMKFAKIQTASLDPQKISGVCGRLKCCLRYEYDVYVELKSNLPHRGDQVRTRDGFVGRVFNYQVLKQTVSISDGETSRVVTLGEIVDVEKGAGPKRKRKRKRDASEVQGKSSESGRRSDRRRPPSDRGPRDTSDRAPQAKADRGEGGERSGNDKDKDGRSRSGARKRRRSRRRNRGERGGGSGGGSDGGGGGGGPADATSFLPSSSVGGCGSGGCGSDGCGSGGCGSGGCGSDGCGSGGCGSGGCGSGEEFGV